jgi:hypothetical protein
MMQKFLITAWSVRALRASRCLTGPGELGCDTRFRSVYSRSGVP